jgi:hypothetical protein
LIYVLAYKNDGVVVVNSEALGLDPGANPTIPTIASYNASAVNFYNAAGSLARFEKKILVLAAWQSGHRVRLRNEKTRVRIPLGHKVLRET